MMRRAWTLFLLLLPCIVQVMVRIVKEIFSEDEVAIFEGDTPVSTALLALPFDHIFFTGSPAVGKVVMAAAAKHLTSVTLELGGKSPTIVDETADLKLAARTIVWGKYTNNGQTCIAPDYIYVHASVKDQFVKEVSAVLTELYGTSMQSQMNSPWLARVVNERHTKRLAGLLTDAVQKGAKVSFDGNQSSPGWNAPPLAPWLEAAVQKASQATFGREAALMGEGGTIPFIGMLGEKFPQAQFVITGVLGPHSNAHGPNEFLHIPTAKRVTAAVARVLADHCAEE